MEELLLDLLFPYFLCGIIMTTVIIKEIVEKMDNWIEVFFCIILVIVIWPVLVSFRTYNWFKQRK